MRLFPILASLLLAGALSAQTWSLIHPDRIGNYKLNSEDLLSAHIWVDSMQALPGGDTLFFLNRLARLVFDAEPPDDVIDFGLTNQQQFLQRQVRKAPDGGYWFEGDSSTFLLYGGRPIGAEWLFDTTQLITALVLDQWEQLTFNLLDSVQSLLLSTQDTILLSKTFGILWFPEFSQPGHFFELVGLDGTPYGEQVPKGPDFFLIEPGDVLYYEGADYAGPDSPGPRYKGRFVLEDKSMDNDTLSLLFSRVLRIEAFDQDFETGAWYWKFIGTITGFEEIRLPPDHFSHFYKGQYVAVPANSQEFTFGCTYYPYDSLLYGVVDYFPAGDGSLMKGIGHDPATDGYQPLLALTENGDSLVLPADQNGNISTWDYRVYYQQGPGLREWQGWCFEISGAKVLVGSIIAGDTLGQVYSEEFLFHTGVEEVCVEIPVRVFPNPTTRELHLEAPQDFRFGEVRICSPIGIAVQRIDLQPTHRTILNLEGMPGGLYFLLLTSEDGKQGVVKILKE